MGAAAEASRSGDLLNDTYELCELLESGVVHQSYRARDTRDDRSVRIALLRPELALRAGVAQRFVKGPKALTLIEHPNLARVLSVESDVTGIPFIVEEDLEGESFASMLEGFPDGMPLGVVMNLLPPITEAVAAAHAAGLSHGSLDAEHILIARIAGNTMPKVVGFASGQDLRADVYALGALFYRALSGQEITEGSEHVPLDELVPHVPNELTELVESCLANEDERPADARVVCEALNTLRQSLGGGRASTVNAKPAAIAKPVAKPAVAAKPAAATKSAGPLIHPKPPPRRAIERDVTAPQEAPSPVDALAQTALDTEDFEDFDPFGTPARPSVPPVIVRALPEAPPLLERKSSRAKHAADQAAHAATQFAQPAVVMAAAPAPADPFAFPMVSGKPPPPLPSTKNERRSAPNEKREGKSPLLASNATAADAAAEAASPAGEAPQPPTQAGRGRGGKTPKARAPSDKIAVAGPARMAAAFGALDGEDNIEQGETQAGELGRAFRQSLEDERLDRKATRSKNRDDAAPVGSAGAAPPPLKPQAKGAGNKTAAEVLAMSQLLGIEEERDQRRRRFFDLLLMLLFAFGLLRAVPLLGTPDPQVAREVLGTKLTLSVVAFSALTLVVLVRTWGMQIQTKAVSLRPVTLTLKVVAACVVLASLGYILPAGSLGMLETGARRSLPWGSAGFFLFLGIHGLMQGVQDARTNLVGGAFTALLYGGALIGSYRVTSTVILPNLRHRSHAPLSADALRAIGTTPKAVFTGEAQPGADKIDVEGVEAADDGFHESTLVGASEEEDMKSIREMGKARKSNSKNLENLNDKIPDLVR